jgi:hypothetical protein
MTASNVSITLQYKCLPVSWTVYSKANLWTQNKKTEQEGKKRNKQGMNKYANWEKEWKGTSTNGQKLCPSAVVLRWRQRLSLLVQSANDRRQYPHIHYPHFCLSMGETLNRPTDQGGKEVPTSKWLCVSLCWAQTAIRGISGNTC